MVENGADFSTSICSRHAIMPTTTSLSTEKWGLTDREQKCSEYNRYTFLMRFTLFCMIIEKTHIFKYFKEAVGTSTDNGEEFFIKVDATVPSSSYFWSDV